MTLEDYKNKRDFNKTSEPAGGEVSTRDRIFVIQEHDASHLHYDLRLSMDGVLKSWAVPKIPPEKEGIKRLAIMTEDHPLDYASYEGEIPPGEYGAGTVKIWDKGFYELEEQEKDKKIIFTLKGKKIKGPYALIRFNKGGAKAWLFFKRKGRD